MYNVKVMIFRGTDTIQALCYSICNAEIEPMHKTLPFIRLYEEEKLKKNLNVYTICGRFKYFSCIYIYLFNA